MIIAKRKMFLLWMVTMFFIAQNTVFADRALSRKEIIQILQLLTSVPKDCWVSSGEIVARHEQFKASNLDSEEEIKHLVQYEKDQYLANENKVEIVNKNQALRLNSIDFNMRYKHLNEMTMVSEESVICDNGRFIWSIDVLSRIDSINQKTANPMSDQFDVKLNTSRIFCWDGKQYTRYYKSANSAIVTESVDDIPVKVNGPLTAGVVPWGHGYYSLEKLLTGSINALEILDGNVSEIHMNIEFSKDYKASFILDPSKEYSVLNATEIHSEDKVTMNTYDEYENVDGQWIPKIIMIEKYDYSHRRPLRSRDVWNMSKIVVNKKAMSSTVFQVNYNQDAIIEHRPSFTDQIQMYRYTKSDGSKKSRTINTDKLLKERLKIAQTSITTNKENCATLAVRYVASQLEIPMDNVDLSMLIDSSGNGSSLLALSDYFEELSLYHKAVKTDLKTLKSLKNCHVILHLPGKNHYVVLGEFNDKYVRLIDLTKANFYYRIDTSMFWKDWGEGVALIISEYPINLPETSIDINPIEQQAIIGADTCKFGCYQCTKVLQYFQTEFCPQQTPQGECLGTYTRHRFRKGCDSGGTGSCLGTTLIKKEVAGCRVKAFSPSECELDGSWAVYHMRACQ